MPYSNRQFKSTNVNYLNKDFDSFKSSLIEYAKTYFPNSYKDFNETSPGMMLLEMSAYVGDVLSFYIDQQYKEMMLPIAQERKNIKNIANMLGYKVKPTIPAYTEMTIKQTIGVTGDLNNKKPNFNDAIILDKNVQITSDVDSDLKFETLDIVDFTVSQSHDKAPVEYEFDDDGVVTSYQLERKVNAISGETKTQTFTVGSPQQYLRLSLPETNVIDIISVKDTNNGNEWYEVDYLAQDKVPIEKWYGDGNTDSAYTDIGGNTLNTAVPYSLQYIKTGKRFITEIDDSDVTTMVFGNGVLRNGGATLATEFVNTDAAGMVFAGEPDTSSLDMNIDPLAADSRMTLGETPSNTSLVVTYRVGGGISSNVASGDLTTVDNLDTYRLGSVTTVGKNVTFENEIPARGGGDGESVEEIRKKAKAFFATQNRCVTQKDYEARILNMPPKFGSIAKVFVERTATIIDDSVDPTTFSNLSGVIDSVNALLTSEVGASDDAAGDATRLAALNTFATSWDSNGDGIIDNDNLHTYQDLLTTNYSTLNVHILAYDVNKNLITLPVGATNTITHPLKQNIKEYLENYRMITDEVDIINGKIINFGVAFEVVAHRSANKSSVKMQCIQKIEEYFNIDKLQFHEPMYTSDLEYELMGINGVRSVSWLQLTQDFNQLGNSRTLPGLGDVNVLWDYNQNHQDGIGSETEGHSGNYGWQYDFKQFYNETGAFVAPGVILPSVSPSVFELKHPRKNIRGIVR